MKTKLIATATIAVMIFSSCSLNIWGTRHHHAAGIEIRASDNVNPKDSIHTNASTEVDKK